MKLKIVDVVRMVALLLVLATLGGIESDMVAIVPGVARIVVLFLLLVLANVMEREWE